MTRAIWCGSRGVIQAISVTNMARLPPCTVQMVDSEGEIVRADGHDEEECWNRCAREIERREAAKLLREAVAV